LLAGALGRGDPGVNLPFHLLALELEQALAPEAGAGAVFLGIRALEEDSKHVIGPADSGAHDLRLSSSAAFDCR
jgi:hypothetical protein